MFFFSHLLQKLEAYLAGWKTHQLSFAGRVTLAKSVLSTLSNHLMQYVYIPKSVCDSFDKMIR